MRRPQWQGARHCSEFAFRQHRLFHTAGGAADAEQGHRRGDSVSVAETATAEAAEDSGEAATNAGVQAPASVWLPFKTASEKKVAYSCCAAKQMTLKFSFWQGMCACAWRRSATSCRRPCCHATSSDVAPLLQQTQSGSFTILKHGSSALPLTCSALPHAQRDNELRASQQRRGDPRRMALHRLSRVFRWTRRGPSYLISQLGFKVRQPVSILATER